MQARLLQDANRADVSAQFQEAGEFPLWRAGSSNRRTAQARFGKRPLNGEEGRWGLEHLNIDDARLKGMGYLGLMQNLKLSCSDHECGGSARVQQWDGANWTLVSDWIAEQNINVALRYASHGYVLDTGRVALSGSAAELLARGDLQDIYLGKH